MIPHHTEYVNHVTLGPYILHQIHNTWIWPHNTEHKWVMLCLNMKLVVELFGASTVTEYYWMCAFIGIRGLLRQSYTWLLLIVVFSLTLEQFLGNLIIGAMNNIFPTSWVSIIIIILWWPKTLFVILCMHSMAACQLLKFTMVIKDTYQFKSCSSCGVQR